MTFNRHVKSYCDILVPTVKIEGNEYVLRLLQAYLGPFQTTKLKPFCEKSYSKRSPSYMFQKVLNLLLCTVQTQD